jgi:hypothetical protein
MTFKEAKQKVAAMDRMTITKKPEEFRVNYKGGKEPTAYYTDDLEDAVETARVMSYAP